MNHRVLGALVLSLLVISISAAQEPVGQDRVKVRLVYIDTLVTDSDGNTVPDLTQDDFLLSVGGQEQEIEAFDSNCQGGAIPDPVANKKTWRDPVAGSQVPRRIVLAFDYYNLPSNSDRAG